MPDLRPFQPRAFRPELPDEQPHRPALPRQFPLRPAPFGCIPQQPVIGVARIRIRHHDIGAQHLTTHQPHTRGATRFQHNLIDLGIQPQATALRSNHPRQRQRKRRHPAHRIMNPEFLLQMADQDIHRRHMKRIAADEQRVKRQREPQGFVFDARRRMALNRLVGPQPRKGRQHLEQIRKPVHRALPKVFKPEPIALFGIL